MNIHKHHEQIKNSQSSKSLLQRIGPNQLISTHIPAFVDRKFLKVIHILVKDRMSSLDEINLYGYSSSSSSMTAVHINWESGLNL